MRLAEQRKPLFTLAALIVTISVLHYTTGTSKGYFHEIYKVLYYIPIILSAFQFGIPGGLTTSLIISVIYLPHVIFQWQGDLDHNVSRFLEIVLYNVVAYITGRLVEGERSERKRYEQAAEELRESYEKLKRQSETLAEIEEQLRHADRLAVMGELAATLAHEVRNPLGSIRGAVEILQDDYPRENPNYEFLQILIKEVDRLNQVIENYLSLARSKAPTIHEFGLRDAVLSVVNIISAKARKESVDIQCRFPDHPVTVKADENKFRQVLLNLLLNALAAIDGTGHITIDSRIVPEANSQRELEITVSDTGKGIPASVMEEIFKPFYTTREGGTGLGLPITKRIADEYGWDLRLQSKEGEGTHAILRIPLQEGDDEA
jgi:signal transduction histidine kinase